MIRYMVEVDILVHFLWHGWDISWKIWYMVEVHILVHGWVISWMLWHMIKTYIWCMIHGYYETCLRHILAHGLWIWHMHVTWMVSISMAIKVTCFDDDVNDEVLVSVTRTMRCWMMMIATILLSMTDWLSVTSRLSWTMSMKGWFYTHISGWKEGARKGGCILLLIEAKEYRELELPSHWSL